MTKNELVAKAIELGSKLTKTDLLKLNNTALEGIVKDLEDRKQKDTELEQMRAMMEQILEQQKEQILAQHEEVKEGQEEVKEDTNQLSRLFSKSAVTANSSAYARRQQLSEIPNDRTVSVMSGVSGTLFWRSPISQVEYEFLEYGVVEEIPFSDIKAMRNRSPRLLKENLLIILDQDIAEGFGLSDQYKNLLLPEDIGVIIKDYHGLVDYFKTAPEASRTVLLRYAIDLYAQNKLVDLNIIRFFEDKFNFNFQDTILTDRIDLVTEQ